MRLVVIGGSDAGISAALRARELASDTHISLMLADAFPNFSICGLPFFLSGETPDWQELAHRTEFEGIEMLRDCRAGHIDVDRLIVTAKQGGSSRTFSYDRLVIGTGASPVRPPITGLEQYGVFLLHTMEDSFRIQDFLAMKTPRSALIIGAGYIGVEMADALTHKGINVTLASRPQAVLSTVEPELGHLVQRELETHHVKVRTGMEVIAIHRSASGLIAQSTSGEELKADLILVAAGVRPNTDLARCAGITLGYSGAIAVSRRMETNVPGIYAAGDCVETWHRTLQAHTYLPLGTTSHKQGRVAGENAIGGKAEFAGALGTQVVKVFDLVIARTGLLDSEARDAGFDPLTVQAQSWDHQAYYPGATKLHLRVTGDRSTGRLLGAQMVGSWGAEVATRIDIFAIALFHGMRVEELNELDLSYTPPLSSPWDPVQMGAQAWSREIQKQTSSVEALNV